MILVDTSVWVDHLRRGNAELEALLVDGLVGSHPFVLGELMLGTMRRRARILEYVGNLPLIPEAEHGEVVKLVEGKRLAGAGLGWVDTHLLAAALLAQCPLWSLDKALAGQARRLGIAA